MFEGRVVQTYSAYSLLSIRRCTTRSKSNIHGYHYIRNLLSSCCMRGKISTQSVRLTSGDRIHAYSQPESMTVLISWHPRLIGNMIPFEVYLYITMALLWSWSSLGQRKIFPTHHWLYLTMSCLFLPLFWTISDYKKYNPSLWLVYPIITMSPILDGANGREYGDMRDYTGPTLFQPHQARHAIRDAH